MLTTIAIVGVLASLLLVVLGKARNSARQAVCVANLHSIGIASKLYQNDHRGRLPPPVDLDVNPSRTWEGPGWFPELLKPYLDSPSVWNCPSQPPERHFGRNGAWRAGNNWNIPSYAMNSVVGGQLYQQAVQGLANGAGHTQILMTEGRAIFWDSGSISTAQSYVQAVHDQPATNVFLFVDGRVEKGAQTDMIAYTQGGGSAYRIITLKKYRP
jgi:Protein of unknown function (DUF1559).